MASKSNSTWYYGWNIVAMAAFLTMLSTGLRMGIGPFVIPMSEGLSVSRGWLSSIIALGVMTYGLSMPLAGFLIEKFGTQKVIILGAFVVNIAIYTTVYAPNAFIFALSFGVLLSFGLSFVSNVSFTPLVARWFIQNRAMALIFLTTGSMAGIAVMTPVFTKLILWIGWERTLIGFAAVFFLISLFASLTIFRHETPEKKRAIKANATQDHGSYGSYDGYDSHSNEDIQDEYKADKKSNRLWVERKVTLLEAIKTLPFWQLVVGAFACGFSMNLLGAHAVPMLIDHGFSEEVSAFGVGLIGFVAIFSTIAIGRISNLIEHRLILQMIYLVRGLAFIALFFALTPLQLYTIAIVGGLVWTGNMALSSSMVADIYGVESVGILYGWTFVAHQIGGTLSVWLGGAMYDFYHSHFIAFGMAGLLLFTASLVSLKLPTREQFSYCLPPFITSNYEKIN